MKLSMLGSGALVACVFTSLLLLSPVLAKSYGRDLTPEETATIQRADDLVAAGDASCQAGNYAEGEKDYKAAKVVQDWNVFAERGLAEALVGEGRYSEAVEIYRTLLAPNPRIGSSVYQEARTQMGFAIALSQDGQWEEAVSVYEQELPNTINWGAAPRIEVHFNPNVPKPSQLQALAHVAIGTEYLGHSGREEAFLEFIKAMQSDPNSAYSNYYYGYGWRGLTPADQAKFGTAQQAKAALQKAVLIGNADVKKAAEKALKAAG